MEVNKKLKNYLKEKGIKQRYLAEKTGLSEKTISLMINCQRNISASEIYLIAKALDENVDIFLN